MTIDSTDTPMDDQEQTTAGEEAQAGPQLVESSVEAPRRPHVSPPPEEAPQRVLIVGSAHGWETAPFHDPSWSVWSLSRMYHHIPRWSAWFELHPWDRLCERLDGKTPEVEQQRNRQEYQRWLMQDHGRPIFMQENRPEVPGCVRFPLEAIKGAFPFPYFTNSVGYMLALAILQGAKEIGIWGIDMATQEEYTTQRPGVEYWVGVAVGAGIKVTIPELSDLCKSRVLYGYGDDELHTKLSYKLDLAKRAGVEAEKAIRQAQLAKAHNEGAEQILDWVLNNF